MSLIQVYAHPSGTGTLTVQSPNTNSNRTLSLPDGSGTLTAHTRATAQTATGSQLNFTSIPQGVRKVTVMFAGVSTTGAADILVQIGSGGTVQTTGYDSLAVLTNTSSGTTGATSTAAFNVRTNAASAVVAGHMVIERLDGNLWIASHACKGGPTWVLTGGGHVTLSGLLDTLRISTTDAFDAGTVNVAWEF
jgi:hypothetical protein